MNASNRNITLDALRGIAILLVLLGHAYLPTGPLENTVIYKAIHKVMETFQRGGWTGVDLFFALSGFLVSGLLFKEYSKYGSINTGRFILRRSFKIYPSFVVFIILASATEIVLTHWKYPVESYIADLFFVSNYLEGRWSHTWSLDVEEFFYLTFPFLVSAIVARRQLNLRNFLVIYAGVVAITFVGRFFANYNQPYSFRAQFQPTHLRVDGLFFGAVLSYLYHFKQDVVDLIVKYRGPITILSLVGVIINFVIWKGGMRSVITLTTNPIFYGLLMIIALKSDWLQSRPLAYIGRHSYNIYLWHAPLFFYSEELINALGLDVSTLSGYAMYLAVYILGGLIPGIIITKLIEDPVLKIRDRYFPAKSGRLQTAEVTV